MSEPTKPFSIWPWVLRFVLMAIALSAPIVTFRAFTDPETSNPQKEERLHDIEEQNRLQRDRSRAIPRQKTLYENPP